MRKLARIDFKRPGDGGFYIQMAGIQQVRVGRLAQGCDSAAHVAGVARADVGQHVFQCSGGPLRLQLQEAAFGADFRGLR